jgi:hypothetical protein
LVWEQVHHLLLLLLLLLQHLEGHRHGIIRSLKFCSSAFLQVH